MLVKSYPGNCADRNKLPQFPSQAFWKNKKFKKNWTLLWWLWLWTIKSQSEWSKTHSALSFPAQLILLLTYLIMTGLGKWSHCISCQKPRQWHPSLVSPNHSMYLLSLGSIKLVRLEWFGRNGLMFVKSVAFSLWNSPVYLLQFRRHGAGVENWSEALTFLFHCCPWRPFI